MNTNKLAKLKENEDKYIYKDREHQHSSCIKTLTKKDEIIEQCAYLIGEANNIAVITGAGISTGSGIPDFRGANGIYSENPEEIFDFKHFKKNPYDLQRLLINLFNGKHYEPTKAHYLLNKLQRDKNTTIITQNIDPLHDVLQKDIVVGKDSDEIKEKGIYHVHGTLATGHCNQCKESHKLLWEEGKVTLESLQCECGGFIRPDIVFYGENILYLNESIQAVKDADLLIILGTSLEVFPVAELPSYAKATTPIILINRDETYLENNVDVINIHEDISDTLEKIMDKLY